MATLVIHHLSSEAHPSSRRRADIHFAPAPLGWTVIGRRREPGCPCAVGGGFHTFGAEKHPPKKKLHSPDKSTLGLIDLGGPGSRKGFLFSPSGGWRREARRGGRNGARRRLLERGCPPRGEASSRGFGKPVGLQL